MKIARAVWTQFHFSFGGVGAAIISKDYAQNACIAFSFSPVTKDAHGEPA
jgi:hypothetical protein